MPDPFLVYSNRLNLIKVVQRLENCIFAEQDPALEEVGEEDFSLVWHVLRCWDGKNIVEFLLGSLVSEWDI